MKRFTDTDIWNEDWFNELEIEYQMFWFYLKDNCNHAGIWKPNKSRFEQITKHKIDLKKALELFNAEKIRIEVLKSGHWFIISFFKFQYGETMNLNNRVHKSISDIYEKENITLTSIRGQIDLKDRVKDKDKDKDKEKINNDIIEKTELQIFVSELKNVSKLSSQLSFKESEKLTKEYPVEFLKEYLEKMDNWKPLCQKNDSVYLTLKNWINSDKKKGKDLFTDNKPSKVLNKKHE